MHHKNSTGRCITLIANRKDRYRRAGNDAGSMGGAPAEPLPGSAMAERGSDTDQHLAAGVAHRRLVILDEPEHRIAGNHPVDEVLGQPGLEGVAATKSSISYLDGKQGILTYRGYPIVELAENSTFEETAYLLLDAMLRKHGYIPPDADDAILAYAGFSIIYSLAVGLGFLLMSLIAGALYAIEGTQINLLGIEFTLEGVSRATLYIIGLVVQILILTSFYLVMPLGKLSFRHALIGGITAGLLWEVVRHLLVWYFSTLSVVSLVYGSLATAIVFLLSLEIAGLILLFGAQVIAEFERFRPDEPNVEGIHD